MQLAVQTPVLKMAAVGGVALAMTLGASMVTHGGPHPVSHRLTLHAPSLPDAIYLTAWDRGDVDIAFEGNALPPLRFTTRALVSDGCRWLGTETLVPIDGHRYAYTYSETILSCEPGAIPYMATPREGIVTVDE